MPLPTQDPQPFIGVPIAKPIRRRRGVDRGVVVAVGLIAFVALAVAKPWDFGKPGPTIAALASRSPAPTSTTVAAAPSHMPFPGPVALPTPVPLPTSGPLPTPTPLSDLQADPATLSAAWHQSGFGGGWGVGALVPEAPLPASLPPGASVVTPSEPPHTFQAFWHGFEPTDPNPYPLATGDSPVVALAVTSPPHDPILGLRVWSSAGDGGYVAVRELPDISGGASTVVLPPALAGSGTAVWLPGPYRLEVLTGHDILRFPILVPGAVRVSASSGVGLYTADEIEGLVHGLGPGLVVVRTSDGLPRSGLDAELLPVQASAPLDDASAWLDLGGAATPPLTVTSGPSPGTSVIAITLGMAAGEVFKSATLTDLDTGADPVQPTLVTAGRGAIGSIIIFLPTGSEFAAGTYRLDVRWRTVKRIDSQGSYNLELSLDGGSPDPSPLLDGVRAFAPFAGDWAVLTRVGDGVVSTQPPRWRTMPTLAQVGPTCHRGTIVPPGTTIVGVAFPDQARHGVTVDRIAADGAPLHVAANIDSTTVDGLAVMAPLSTPTWAPGVYAVTIVHSGLDVGVGSSVLVFCVDGGAT